MAPNKRAENKRGICFYVESKLVDAFKRLCERAGITMAEALTAHMVSAVKQKEKED